MSTDNQEYQDLQKIFLEALEMRTPGARAAYLDKACEGDATRREAIEALLKEYEEGGDSVGASSDDGPVTRDSAMFVPGKVLADRYRIVTLLGKGGMGEVYRADDLKLDQAVALKFLPAALAQDQRLLKALYNEVKLARRVTHRHVGRVYDIGEAEGLHFLSMEYIEGEDLGGLLRRIGRLPGDKAIALAQQLCAGLQAAHEEGLLHLDLKPGNLMIDQRGDLRVTDFGLARMTSDAEAEKRRSGTPAYMAPEQLLHGDASERSDLYAVGLILYEMFTGKRMHGNRTAEDLAVWHQADQDHPMLIDGASHLAPAVNALILTCIARDPMGRPKTVKKIAAALESIAPASVSNVLNASVVPEAQPISVDALKTSDVFISYAPVDDSTLDVGHDGWISQFHRNLEVRLEQLSGDPVSVWRDSQPADTARREAIMPLLPEVKTMVSVLSPPFVKSPSCLQEVEAFTASRPATVEGRGLFNVFKRPVSAQAMPPALTPLLKRFSSFDFYEVDPGTGRVREYDPDFGSEAKQQYFERIYDLAQEICISLEPEDDSIASDSTEGMVARHDRKTIYLAETTSDLSGDRDKLRRELMERGHRILPDRPLPLIHGELEVAVRAYLEQSDLAIHLIGRHYGVVPEGGKQSLIELQNELSIEHSGQVAQRVFWTPFELKIDDERQQRVIEGLVNDPRVYRGGEVIRGAYKSLKEALLDKLRKPLPPPEQAASPSGSDTPQVYLICDRDDEAAIEPLEDYLFELGLNVILPDFEAEEQEIQQLHMQNLRECDAALIYYGTARKAWVEIKLRDIAKAPGYGRPKPLEARAVYIAPPFDRRKERFRWQDADMIRGEETFEGAALDAFTAAIKLAHGGQV